MEPVGLSREIFQTRYPGSKTWADKAKVVAKHISSVEPEDKKPLWFTKFNDIIRSGDFIPGGRITAGSGKSNAQLLNCYFLYPEDDVNSIGDFIGNVYKISCGGGGVGINFSKIRPRGDSVGTIPYSAPGTVSNMKTVDGIGEEVRSGGGRRTALLALLEVNHPDTLWFLSVKLDKKQLTNFNISVGITNKFIEAIENDEEWVFSFRNKNYYTFNIKDKEGNTVEGIGFDEADAIGRANSFLKTHWEQEFVSAERTILKAKDLWERIYTNSIETGCPGILNVDFNNNYTNVSYFEPELGYNPCTEACIPNFGNCCLGHINLNNMIKTNSLGELEPDYSKIAKTARIGVRFLDDTLTANHYPITECKGVGERSRRIGLGVTGLHYFLIRLGYRYGDETCCEFLERLFQTIRDEAYKASINIAKEKGAFPAFNAKNYLKEEFAKTLPPRIRTNIKKYGIRNAVLLAIAPVGTGSLVLGVSSGVEPIFSAFYYRKYMVDNVIKKQLVVDPLFKQSFLRGKDVSNFIGSYDITPEEHLRVQTSIQKFICQAISKTVNVPEDFTEGDVLELKDTVLDYAPYVKGVTIYRAGSKGDEPFEALPIKGKTDDEIMELIERAVDYGQESSQETNEVEVSEEREEMYVGAIPEESG